MAPEKLKEAEIEAGLSELGDWRRAGEWMERTYERPSFPEAVDSAGRVAGIAEELQHHPQIIIDHKRLTLRLTTKDAGGLTALDLQAAARFDAVLD
ncbi:4a-hydroxytetrahydrobiopterin dehydratase [Paenibacillus sp. 1P07SE]|uniref:4a-hydroxytetrahydrobiopterin dehydratase n=1 Tax=Paenibacillus sp. 1P07SE TaxID=3132209 RepID=UPI0039A588BC